jgi:hypothetical protein
MFKMPPAPTTTEMVTAFVFALVVYLVLSLLTVAPCFAASSRCMW